MLDSYSRNFCLPCSTMYMMNCCLERSAIFLRLYSLQEHRTFEWTRTPEPLTRRASWRPTPWRRSATAAASPWRPWRTCCTRGLPNTDPTDDKWIGRDRFVLSAGPHVLTQYTRLYLGGLGLELGDLESLRTLGARRRPATPSTGTAFVETTTGPLGRKQRRRHGHGRPP